MAGVSRLQYRDEIRLIRVMCSGRVDLEFILRAFANGHDGVLVGACRLNECNYVTHGNYDTLSNMYLCKKLLDYIGVNPDRLRVEFMSAADGIRLVETINDFTQKIKTLGPLGQSEEIDTANFKVKFEALRKLVPFLKLVERERLRVPVKSEAAYREFYTSEEVDRLLDELILDKLEISQIMLLLREQPLSTGELSERLGLNPSAVAKHMDRSSRQGLVRYDEGAKRYCATLA